MRISEPIKVYLPNVSLPKFETTILDRNGTEIRQNFEQMVSENKLTNYLT